MDTNNLETNSSTSTTGRMKKPINILLVCLLILAAAVASYFYYQYSDLSKNPNKVAENETKSLVVAVGKLMLLPSDETPTVATVSDPSKLKDQPFFSKSQKGDRILLYVKSRKAILYRPTTNQIIEVAPINISNQQQPAPSPSPKP